MIYINRDRIKEPKIFSSSILERERKELKEYFEQEVSYKQVKYKFKMDLLKACYPALKELFFNKCCYCESEISSVSFGDIEHFRPKTRAINLDGSTHEGYWWLTNEWFNLYLACSVCNQTKANRFPVKGIRLKYPQIDPDIENYLLIDPCRKKDHQKKHFKFMADGQIIPLTERGEITIGVISLNRKELIKNRQVQSHKINSFLKLISSMLSQKKKSKEYKEILNFLRDDVPYLGLARDLVGEWMNENGRKLEIIDPETYIQIIKMFDLPKLTRKKRYKKRVKKEYTLEETDQSSKQAYYSEYKRLNHVEIENFKVIDKAVIDFPQIKMSEIGENSMLLIGENAVGKSSILQAIALALIGEEKANELRLNGKKIVRRGRGITESRVKITLSDREHPLEMTISKRTGKIKNTSKGPQVMVVGYGSQRTLPEEGEKLGSDIDPTNIEGLFRHRAKLRDVEAWLGDTSRVNSRLFSEIASAIIELLMIDLSQLKKKKALFRYKNKVKVNALGEAESMEEMCDGYKSVLAYSLDIMMTLASRWQSIGDAEAVVMIDEIGVNLHPRWKINIVSLLRQVFPRVTFIITTHDPICLRGARDGEIYVMKRKPGNKGILIDQINIPPGTSIEQLLLGVWFQMDSTLDLDTTEKLNKHAELMFEGKTENAEEIAELEKILEERLIQTGDNTLFGRFKQVFGEVIEEAGNKLSETEISERFKEKLADDLEY